MITFIEVALALGVVCGGAATLDAYDAHDVKMTIVGFILMTIAIGLIVTVEVVARGYQVPN